MSCGLPTLSASLPIPEIDTPELPDIPDPIDVSLYVDLNLPPPPSLIASLPLPPEVDLPELPDLPDIIDLSLYLDLDLPVPKFPGLSLALPPEIDLPQMPELPELEQLPCPFDEAA